MRITFLLLLTAVAFSNCNVSNKSFKNGNTWIPEDFNPKTSTLLIERVPFRGYTEKMNSFLSGKYPYRYVVVSKEDIDSRKGKYADTKAYPFALIWKTNSKANIGDSHFTDMDIDGYFLDRTKNYSYPPSKKTLNYGAKGFEPIINTIVNKYK